MRIGTIYGHQALVKVGNTDLQDGAFVTPTGITMIGSYAFRGCASCLISVTILSGVTDIWDKAFSGCTVLINVTIANGVTYIGHSAFKGCTSLTSVTIPNSVTHIMSNAFCRCTSLTNVTIASHVIYISDGAFYGCTSLTSVTLGVIQVLSHAFGDCTSLTRVTILNSVTYIGDGAFGGCTSLTSVTISSGVRHIGDSAFRGCTSLTSVTISSGVRHIGHGAFDGTHLTTIIIDADDETEIQRIKNLLPEKLRQFVIPISPKLSEPREKLLADFQFGDTHKLSHDTLLQVSAFAKPEPSSLKKALNAVSLPSSQQEFDAYQTALELVLQRHVTAYKLKEYIQIFKKTIPDGFFSGSHKPLKDSSREILQARDTVQKIIYFLQGGKAFTLSEKEQSMIQQRPTLLAKIPAEIQMEIGINPSANLTDTPS